VFFPPYRLSRDGAYIGARFLELLAAASDPVSEVVARYADYHFVRRNVEYADDDERDEMLSAARAYVETADAEPNTTDGYRLDYGDAWVLVRPPAPNRRSGSTPSPPTPTAPSGWRQTCTSQSRADGSAAAAHGCWL